MEKMDDYKEKEQALKTFLLDIECLEPLSEWTSRFNLFDILKITRTEIRHSNMLSWLLNPRENHGLGDRIIKGFIQYVVNSFSGHSNIFDLLLMDCSDSKVLREWKNIDILVVSDANEFVLCIENKIDSSEQGDQLNKYRKIIEEHYSKYRKMFVYLSPAGSESSDLDNWCSMGYLDVMLIIENACKKVVLNRDSEFLINNYTDIIRRKIVGDDRLTEICAQIYAKHQKALDLIFENRPDQSAEISKVFTQWAAEATKIGEIEVVLDRSNKSYTRFKTKEMSLILPDAPEAKSGWNTKNHYFYEICCRNKGSEIFIQYALSARYIPDDLLEKCNQINVHYPSKQQKPSWQWRLPFTTSKMNIDEDTSEDQIFEKFNALLREVKDFEQTLMQKMNII